MDFLYLALLMALSSIYGSWIAFLFFKEKVWSINLWTQVWLFVFYFLLPTIVVARHNLGYTFNTGYDDITINNKLYIDISVLFAITLFIASYNSIVLIKYDKFKIYYAKSKNLIIDTNHFSFIIIFAILAFLLSLTSLLLYTIPQGGIVNTFKNTKIIDFEYTVGIFTIFKRFIPLSMYLLLLISLGRNKLIKYAFIPPAIIIMIYYSLISVQRQVMLFYLLTPLFGFLILKKKIITKKLLIFTAMIIMIFPYIHFLNKSATYDKENLELFKNDINIEKYIREFSFPFISIYMAQNSKYELLFFADLWKGFFGNIFPTSLVDDPRPSNSLNSYLFLNKESRSVPPGIIANSFYHLGYAGLIFFAFILGFIVKFTDFIMKIVCENNKLFCFVYSFFFWAFFSYVRTGVLGFSLYSPFFLFMMIFVIMSHGFYTKQLLPITRNDP